MIRCVFTLRTEVEGRVLYNSLYLTDRAPSELGWDTEYPPAIGDEVVLYPQGRPEVLYKVVARQWLFPGYGKPGHQENGMSQPTLDLLVEESKGMYADEK